MGQQGAQICDVIFDDARVPAENLIGGVEGQGFRTAMKVLDKGRLNIAAACTGLAERMLDDMMDYAIGRQQFGRPIAEFQLLQGLFADCKAAAMASRALVLDAARRRDAGESVSLAASCAKMFASEMVGKVADCNVQCMAAMAISGIIVLSSCSAMRVCSVFMKARRKSSRPSSPRR